MTRVTTDLWVSALLRRIFSAGFYGAVVRRGAFEAGTVFITVRARDGGITLYGPAAQAGYDEARPPERRFVETLADADDEAVELRLEKERRFDSDLWVVELDIDADRLPEFIAIGQD